ncbi:MAG TPA: SDR family oxidoreductase [Thermoanaerobaculia bacterium]|nr:SDR family oxidoreductase [Thermoanaerobaculia bacterium]HUM29786.1 SDR family oxidoreductase [Thermoanaerobaculia bacterium]HXK68061.1 SDR family oxidoreductase [Thermoanaerobaculia bacterium]
MTDLSGSHVLITGAASGIGRSLARFCARHASSVILWDIDGRALEEAAVEISAEGGQAHPYTVDVSNREAVYSAASTVRKEVGDVRILVNNAGVVTGKSFLDCSDSEIQKTMEVNSLAHFWTVKAFLPSMIEADGGHIVTIASAAGLMGVARLADYSSSKFANVGFHEALQQELRLRNSPIRMTLVCPYFINTGMFEGVRTRIPFLLPILGQEKVAKRIYKAIRSNRKRLFMPWLVYTVGPLRIFPVVVFNLVADILGVHHTMDAFLGRTDPARSEPGARHES